MFSYSDFYRSWNPQYPTIVSVVNAIIRSRLVGDGEVLGLLQAAIRHATDPQELVDSRDDILGSLRSGCPAIMGVGTIGSSIIGQLLLVNVSAVHGVIFGSGAVVLREGDAIPDGAVIMVRHGEVLTSMDDVLSHVLGIVGMPGSRNETDN